MTIPRFMSGSLAPRETLIHRTDKQHRRININVGGEQHSPYVSTLRNVPDCPLAWIIRNEYRGDLDYDSETDVYFFDRHPGNFSQILNYFQTGKLHCPRDVCGPMFQDELNYWGIDETQMEACCWPNYTKHREIQENLKLFHITRQKQNADPTTTEKNNETDLSERHNICSGQSKWRRYQRIIWEVLDEPYSSKIAKVFAYTSLGFIILSIITYSLTTIEELQYRKVKCPQKISNFTKTINITIQSSSDTLCNEETYAANILRGFEMLFAIWFTLEIILRFTFCPHKCEFVKTFSNWVDLIAVIPVYLILILTGNNEALMILNMVRYVRIFRFFKLLYDLHILGKTLQASMHQMFILLLILCIPTIIFSSIVYYTEIYMGSIKSKEDFKEIPQGMWWAVVTMTTVGYGRVTPNSFPGKLLGAAASVVGILMVSMTASVIGTSFQQYYNVARAQLRIPAKTPTAIKKIHGKDTLLARLRRDNRKPASIKSDDSKDSGYGRSPIPPGDSESGNSPPWRHTNENSPPSLITHREKNVVISMGNNSEIKNNLTASV